MGRIHENKSDTLREFLKILLKIENEKDTHVCRIRSDRGGEFKDSSVTEYCIGNGYKHEFSAPKTPQQNRIVERKNKTLQDMARVMLHEKIYLNIFGLKPCKLRVISLIGYTLGKIQNILHMNFGTIKSLT